MSASSAESVMQTLLVAAGVTAAGMLAIATSAIGYAIGVHVTRDRIKAKYRLVSKAAWSLGEKGLIVNVTKKRVFIPPRRQSARISLRPLRRPHDRVPSRGGYRGRSGLWFASR